MSCSLSHISTLRFCSVLCDGTSTLGHWDDAQFLHREPGRRPAGLVGNITDYFEGICTSININVLFIDVRGAGRDRATFPYQYSGSPQADGVVVHFASFPGECKRGNAYPLSGTALLGLENGGDFASPNGIMTLLQAERSVLIIWVTLPCTRWATGWGCTTPFRAAAPVVVTLWLTRPRCRWPTPVAQVSVCLIGE